MHPVLITDARFLGYASAFENIETRSIHTAKLSGGAWQKTKAALGLLRGMFQARRHLKILRPIAVVGFGGYPSFPTMLAARTLRIPCIIHEQNAVLGRANRMLAAKMRMVATAYPAVKFLPDAVPSRQVGNPVRDGIAALVEVPYPEIHAGGALQLLVLGGSQGASILSNVVPQAVALLPPELRTRLRIVQQCRAADIEAVREAYAALGAQAELAEFFTNIPARLGAAHLVISRAGASTIAEVTVAGIPSILVPLPSALDDHQTANAQGLANAGGAWLMAEPEFTPDHLANQLAIFLGLPQKLVEAGRKARQFGVPDAAERLLALVREVAG